MVLKKWTCLILFAATTLVVTFSLKDSSVRSVPREFWADGGAPSPPPIPYQGTKIETARS